MITIFLLSNEAACDSSKTSGNVIKWLITLFNSNLNEEVLQLRIGILQPIVRKMAHFTLYAVGGGLIYIMFVQFKESIKLTKLTSIILGVIYAESDEIQAILDEENHDEYFEKIFKTWNITPKIHFSSPKNNTKK